MSKIACENLSIHYPLRAKPTIENFSHIFPLGQRTLLIGPSGAGKSSLILALNGLIPKSIDATVSGKIIVDELNPQEEDTGTMSKKLAILFQDPETQFCMLMVEEEVAFGLENLSYSKQQMDKVIEKCLKKVGLLERRKDSIHSLSGGMKQKLAFACLMAIDPDILVLDEPTANLDPQASQELIELLDEWSQVKGKTLIVIEHQVDDVLPIVDHVVALNKKGDLLAEGPPREVFYTHGNELVEEGIFLPHPSTLALQMPSKKWNPFPLTTEEFKQQVPITEEQSSLYLDRKQPKTLLQVENVTYHYPDHPPVLEDVNFSIAEGKITAIVGENGAGKSTLSKLLVRALKPQEGSISFKGKKITNFSDEEFMQEISLVMQRPETQFIAESVEAEMAFGPKLLGLSNWEQDANQLLEDFDLTAYKKAHPYTLSQGQKRRLSVAIMLTNGQKCLILDEPTFGQDAQNTHSLMKQLEKKKKEGYTFIMITHDMNLVERFASKVIVLNHGKAVFEGAPNELFHNEKNKAIIQQANLTVPRQLELERLAETERGTRYA